MERAKFDMGTGDLTKNLVVNHIEVGIKKDVFNVEHMTMLML